MIHGPSSSSCPIHNPELEQAIIALPGINEVPHCFLHHLHQAVFLCPVSAANGHACSDLRPDGHYAFIPCSEGGKPFLALFTSSEQLGLWKSDQAAAHVHLSIGNAVGIARENQFVGLILNPGSDKPLRLSHEAFDKVLAISLRQKTKPTAAENSTLEIDQGDEMIVSTPDPAPPAIFLQELARVLRTVNGLREAYLFELAWKSTTGELVLGVSMNTAPRPGQIEAALDQISPEARQAAAGFDHFDLMILDDPALIEVVSSTVPSLLAGGQTN